MPVDRYTANGLRVKELGCTIDEFNSDGSLVNHVPNSKSESSFSWFDFRHAENCYNWKAKIKAMDNATTVLYGTRTTASEDRGSFTLFFHRKSDGTLRRREEWDGVYDFPDLTPVLPTDSVLTADNQALRKAYRRLKEIDTSFQGLTFLGEAGEALRMIRNRGRDLFTGVLGFVDAASKLPKRFPGQKRKRRSASLADLWLEYSFGWKPLAFDIEDAVEAINRYQNKRVRSRITAKGEEKTRDIRVADYAHLGTLPATRVRSLEGWVTTRFLLGLSLESQCLPAARFDTLRRFGVVTDEFIPTLWELTPWSFLVDYFTNVGDIIDAGFTSTRHVKWVCKTTRWSSIRSTSYTPDLLGLAAEYPGDETTFLGSTGGTLCNSVYVQRGPSDLPAPRLELSIPGFSKPGDQTKWLNMAALSLKTRAAQKSLTSF